MPNQKLSDLNEVITPTGDEIMEVASEGVSNNKINLTNLKNFFLSAFRAANNIFTGRNSFAATIGTWQTETFATTQDLDATKQFAVLTLTNNVTFDSVTNAGAAGEAQVLYREVRQDATGSRLASFTTAKFEKIGASFPVLSTAANARDFLTFTRSQNGKWLVTAGLNVS